MSEDDGESVEEFAAYLAVGMVEDALEEVARTLGPNLGEAIRGISAGIGDRRSEIAQEAARAALKAMPALDTPA